MLVRRGLRPSLGRPHLRFPSDISAETADALAEWLGHYAFRLFVRGVIHHSDGFTPEETTMVRPDLTLFVVDTALRLSDKVVPMLTDELARRSETVPAPCRVEREIWALGRHLYVVNSRPDLMTNIGRAIAEGLLAQHPQLV
jgi:hypothetical protein